mgnify:FL=1
MLVHKSIIPQNAITGKATPGFVGINFFAECGTKTSHPRHQLDVDVYTHETSDVAAVTLVHPGQGELQNVRLNLTEEAIDDLRSVLYDVSNQLMLNRNRRAVEAKHEKEKQEAFKAASSMQLGPND